MNYNIPLFDLSYDEEEEKAIIETLRSKWISTGPKCYELESLFQKRLSVSYALTTSSCTAALHLAMLVLGIGKGDEVIVPSLTFAATANVVRYVGATPVFAEVTSLDDLTISPDDIERKITPRTKAIIPMHYAGFAANMDRIMAIAKQHKIKVVEDASHSPLSEYKGKKLGSIGDIGTFSFFSNKNISTGEGGIITSNSKEYIDQAKLLRSHGMTTMSYERAKGHATKYDIQNLGYNYRMDDIRATLGIVQFNKLQGDLEIRQQLRQSYINHLTDNENLIIPFKDNKEFSSNYIFTVILKKGTEEDRDKIRNQLHKAGIQTSVHYPPVHQFTIYRKDNQKLPLTDFIAKHTITLPMYAKLTQEHVAFISHTLNEIMKNTILTD